MGLSGGIGTGRNHQRPPLEMKYYEGRKGGFDPHARIADLDLDGIDAVFLYPTLGLNAGSIQDAPLAAAVCRAYNRWLADFCKPYPDRLFGAAQLPMQSVELAVEEMRHARKELGMRSGFVHPNRYHGRSLDDPAYHPLWAEAQELDFAIALHEGIGGMPAIGADRFDNVGARHIVCHTMDLPHDGDDGGVAVTQLFHCTRRRMRDGSDHLEVSVSELSFDALTSPDSRVGRAYAQPKIQEKGRFFN